MPSVFSSILAQTLFQIFETFLKTYVSPKRIKYHKLTSHIYNPQIKWVYTIYYITFCNFFLIFICKTININAIKFFLSTFISTSIKFMKIYYIIVKIIGSIFNIYLFYFSHLYIQLLLNFCFFGSIKFIAKNIVFNQRPIVINKINSFFSKHCTNYCHQYNIHSTRTIFVIIFIFKEFFQLTLLQ